MRTLRTPDIKGDDDDAGGDGDDGDDDAAEGDGDDGDDDPIRW